MIKTGVVKSTTGKLRGILEDNLHVFKGIPYAQPPIGDLRLKNTVEKEPWQGIFEANEFGPIPPQPFILTSSVGDRPQSEDCLTLNIWTPACDNEERPVLFWIHGGAFYYGGAPSPRYNGKALSQRGDVCVITFNYRLGALGNLYLPEKVSNLGFLDQFSALKWVYNNISKFGGDPANITIFGESAGSTSVCTLLSMPITKPFIRRAICQSGAVSSQGHQAEAGINASKKLFSKLNIKMGDLNALREVSVEEVIEIENMIRTEDLVKRENPAYPPIIDGNNILEHPLVAINKGISKNIDLLIGTNLNEWELFSMLDPQLKYITWHELTEYLNVSFRGYAPAKKQLEEVIHLFKSSRNSPIEVLNAITTELVFRNPSINVAEAQSKHINNTYMYLFTYRSPVLGGIYGATHTLEIPFVFGTLDNTEFGAYPKRDEYNAKISEQIMDSWISFARSGNPNHEGIPEWPKYDIKNRYTILFGNDTRIEKDPYRAERLAIEEIVSLER